MGMTNASKINQCIEDIYMPMKLIKDIKNILNSPLDFNKYSVEYYDSEFIKFKILLYTQMKEKCDKELLNKFLNDCKRKSKKIKKTIFDFHLKWQESNVDSENPKLKSYIIVLPKIYDILEKIEILLLEEIEYFDYKISSDYDILLNNISSSHQEIKNAISNKVTFNLSKIELLIFMHILEKEGKIKFSSNKDMVDFIQNNINYTANEKVYPMIGVESDLSKIKTLYDKKRYNKVLNTLFDKFMKIFRDFNF